MQTKNLVQIRVPGSSVRISGESTAAMPFGIQVAFKDSEDPADARKLVLASGTRGFLLTQDVLSVEDWDAHMLGPDQRYDNAIMTPVPLGQPATGRDWELIEVEGSVHVDTDNLDDTTDPKTALKLVNGKWTPCTAAGDKIAGRLERKLTPKIAANVTRFAIRNEGGDYTPTA